MSDPIKNHRLAVAIAYNAKNSAPIVSAQGQGLVAERIIEIANQANVPIHQSKEIVSLLMKVDLGDQIPEVLYKAIAEILSWIYLLEKNKKIK